jgi:tRNA threonylcarbamoyl adenosine modification protein (Sua5/YciO/YrdC/YwlC family)
MAERVKLHPHTPHQKRIFEIVDSLKEGSVILMPTDSQYALACDYQNKKGIERIRTIRNLGKNDHLTVMCHSLQHASAFARMNDQNFKLIKRLIPGTFTFILPATKEVPRLLVHPKKKTVGIRIPDYPICLNLIQTLNRPLLAITAKLKDSEYADPSAGNREMFLSRFDHLVDVIIDNQQPLQDTESSIVDLTGEEPELIREGPGMDQLKEAVALEGQTLMEMAEV